jgi:hypothetical protein
LHWQPDPASGYDDDDDDSNSEYEQREDQLFPMLPLVMPNRTNAAAPATYTQPTFHHAAMNPVSLEQGHHHQHHHRRRHWLPDSNVDFDGAAADSEYNQPDVPKGAMILSFRLPREPYSERRFDALRNFIELDKALIDSSKYLQPVLGGMRLPKWFRAAAATIFSIEMFPGAEGYKEAMNEVQRKNLRSGFAYGVVMGAEPWPWSVVRDVFWKWNAGQNLADQNIAVAAMKAFNVGLAAGFAQGSLVAKDRDRWRFFWQSMRHSKYANPADPEYAVDKKGWTALQLYDYYLKIGVIFMKLYLKA